MKKFYITAAIPYVNAPPHIGHALEFVQTDAIARYRQQKGQDVLVLSGSDENALKNVQAAKAAGVPLQSFIDKNANLFLKLAKKLNVHFDVFQKGSNRNHHLSSQLLWKLCDKAGDIYKKPYEGLYCVGCEMFYIKEELSERGECFEHPGKKLEHVSEENYFFKLSRYQKKLVDLLEKNKLRIIPQNRKNEVLSFLKQPLQDISISRSNERAKDWGVQVPGDKNQRVYVWFDALNIYQSGIGFGTDAKNYKKWWPADVHVIGKGVIRFHAIFWPAFLLSSKLKLPKNIFVHGYLTVGGKKMSKSLGNVVDPFELVKKYGADAVRYFLLREIPPTEDGDFTRQKFEARYNADLASGLGNLVARVIILAKKFKIQNSKGKITIKNSKLKKEISKTWKKYHRALENFKFNEALASIWELIGFCDRYVEKERPWRAGRKQKEVIGNLLLTIGEIAELLKPFLPETAEKITKQLKTKKTKPLFPRLST